MFTGIIEAVGSISDIQREGTNIIFTIQSRISGELKVDQSIAHDGVCLTVTDCDSDSHTVTAIDETLKKSNLGNWEKGAEVNLERCMLNNGRFDGHIVQGHVDEVGKVTKIEDQGGSWLIDIEYGNLENVTVEKGSITVNGISLTCFNSKPNGFSIAIIPYTMEHTTMRTLKEGNEVNLEFDIVGKYVKRLLKSD